MENNVMSEIEFKQQLILALAAKGVPVHEMDRFVDAAVEKAFGKKKEEPVKPIDIKGYYNNEIAPFNSLPFTEQENLLRNMVTNKKLVCVDSPIFSTSKNMVCTLRSVKIKATEMFSELEMHPGTILYWKPCDVIGTPGYVVLRIYTE